MISAEAASAGTRAEAICIQVRAEILSGARKPEARLRLEELKTRNQFLTLGYLLHSFLPRVKAPEVAARNEQCPTGNADERRECGIATAV